MWKVGSSEQKFSSSLISNSSLISFRTGAECLPKKFPSLFLVYIQKLFPFSLFNFQLPFSLSRTSSFFSFNHSLPHSRCNTPQKIFVICVLTILKNINLPAFLASISNRSITLLTFLPKQLNIARPRSLKLGRLMVSAELSHVMMRLVRS